MKVVDDARELESSLAATLKELEQYLSARVGRNPVATLGLASGIGFILGGGLPIQAIRLLLTLAGRTAAAFVLHDFDRTRRSQHPQSAPGF